MNKHIIKKIALVGAICAISIYTIAFNADTIMYAGAIGFITFVVCLIYVGYIIIESPKFQKGEQLFYAGGSTVKEVRYVTRLDSIYSIVELADGEKIKVFTDNLANK